MEELYVILTAFKRPLVLCAVLCNALLFRKLTNATVLPSRLNVPDAEYDASVTDTTEHALVEKLDLIYGRNAGKRCFTVLTQHHIICQIDSKGDHVLQNDWQT